MLKHFFFINIGLFQIVLLFLVFACNTRKQSNNDILLAKVNDNYLYLSEVEANLSKNLPPDDSIEILNKFVNDWIKKQVIIENAEKYLSQEELDIQKQLDEYRIALLSYKFEQQYIIQNLDTTFSDEELIEFYKNDSANFVLDRDIVKVKYIILPINVPINKLKYWLLSGRNEDLDEIIKYCSKHNGQYHFEDVWIDYSILKDIIPLKGIEINSYLKYTKYYETKDSINNYMLTLNNYKLKNDISPFETVKDKIKAILLNKRKVALIKKMESSMLQDVLNTKQAQIFIK